MSSSSVANLLIMHIYSNTGSCQVLQSLTFSLYPPLPLPKNKNNPVICEKTLVKLKVCKYCSIFCDLMHHSLSVSFLDWVIPVIFCIIPVLDHYCRFFLIVPVLSHSCQFLYHSCTEPLLLGFIIIIIIPVLSHSCQFLHYSCQFLDPTCGLLYYLCHFRYKSCRDSVHCMPTALLFTTFTLSFMSLSIMRVRFCITRHFL